MNEFVEIVDRVGVGRRGEDLRRARLLRSAVDGDRRQRMIDCVVRERERGADVRAARRARFPQFSIRVRLEDVPRRLRLLLPRSSRRRRRRRRLRREASRQGWVVFHSRPFVHAAKRNLRLQIFEIN